MADKQVETASPGELATLDDLAGLLERYQTYLLAGSASADPVRALASNASGSARPALERLHVKGHAGVTELESALRMPRSEDDRRQVLENVDAALVDLRATIAASRSGGTARSRTERPRSRVPIWIAIGLVVGLILGIYGTELPRSRGAMARLWTLLQPVIAAAAAGIIGGLLVQDGLAKTLQKRWLALLVSSVLLVATAPTAVDAAKELFGVVSSKGASGRPATAPLPVPTTSSPASTPPQPAASAPAPPAVPPAADPVSPSPARSNAVQSTRPAEPPARPRELSPECSRLLGLQSIGQPFTNREKTFWEKECAK